MRHHHPFCYPETMVVIHIFSITSKQKDGGIVSSIDLEPVFCCASKVQRVCPSRSNRSNESWNSEALWCCPWFLRQNLDQAGRISSQSQLGDAGENPPSWVTEINNGFKQEAAEKAKTEIVADKGSLNVVVGFQGEILVCMGQTFRLVNTILRSIQIPGIHAFLLSQGNYNYQLFYQPVLKDVGMAIRHLGCSSCKVMWTWRWRFLSRKPKKLSPCAKRGKTWFVYGHVTGIKDQSTFVNKGSASAGLNVEVEAIEVGSKGRMVNSSLLLLGHGSTF